MLILVELFYNFVISTLVGLFGLHLLTKKGLLASKFLGLYFLAFCIRIVLAYFITGGRIIEHPHAFMLVSPIQFLVAPVGFLFVYFMLHPKRKFRVWQAVLFIPFVLHTLELLPFYFGPVEDKINEINLMLQYKSLVDFPGTVTFFSPKVLTFLKVVLSTCCVLASFVLVVFYIQKNKVSYKANQFLLNWLLCYTALGLLSTVFILAYVLEIIGFNDLKFSYADLLMHLAAFVNVVVVLMRPALLDGVTFQSLVSRLHQEDRQAALDEDAEKLQKYEKYAAQLEKYFVTAKPFLTEDTSRMFAQSIFNHPIGNWDVSKVKTMRSMFQDSCFNQPIGNWDVSQVKDMGYLFFNSFFNQPIGQWKVSQVKDMSFMFSKSLFNQDIGDWDVSRVSTMKGMFKDFNDRLPFASKNPFNQAIGRWNVGKVKDMSSLFFNSIFNHPIGDWDVRNVRRFTRMFKNSLFNQPLGSWQLGKAEDMEELFCNSKFNQDLSAWPVQEVSKPLNFDANCPLWIQPKPLWSCASTTDKQ